LRIGASFVTSVKIQKPFTNLLKMKHVGISEQRSPYQFQVVPSIRICQLVLPIREEENESKITAVSSHTCHSELV
jgi:hypothetical protein